MSYTIRPSTEVHVTKAPTIALAGETGSGKTESAMRLARGYVGKDGKFLICDTEEKRALYKKARYQPWDWMDLQPPFTPERYREALDAGKDYAAVILDSGSHEWAGDGGCIDMQAEALHRMSKGDEARAERLTALAWREPKFEHKKFMASLIRYPTLLIVCLRAEPKIKFVKGPEGKMQIVDAGYQPICEKMFGYEMLIFAMMHADNPGVPVQLKKLEPDLESVFIEAKQIDEATGTRLAQWSKTAAPKPEAKAESKSDGLINEAQESALIDMLEFQGVTTAQFVKQAGISKLRDLKAERFEGAIRWIKSQGKP